ncbi:MAG: carbohydrate kinase [Deltaproteobacteria bacterium RIFOXYA12_FULL_58_15]|nr:MAG: carbohydrate kinase [Deltaproteobacteria bacterium RIFOXYA12_FULL_58_15]OGR13607.1 MAG: carbohydrate kinase [Deltaproteobacteria bacterium RIFOXYB12_FULL_58_9]
MASAQDLILAIDLGTSGVKAAVVAVDGRILGTGGTTKVETMLCPNGGAEQDPNVVWDTVVTTCQEAMAHIDDASRVMGVACCSQFSSTIPVDADGNHLMNMVVWMDKRGSPAALRKLPGGKKLVSGPLDVLRFIHVHGVPPLNGGTDSLAHMRWIKIARPEVYAKTAAFLEPMDYVNLKLTGRAATNPCSCFLGLLVDNRKLLQPRYCPGLVRLSGIDADKLPELLRVDEDIGTLLPHVAAQLGVPSGIRVFGGVNDTQAGSFGSYALSGNHAGMSLGTTSVLVTHVGFKKTDPFLGLVSMPSPIPGRYLIMAENGIGGRAVEYFLKKIVFATDGFANHSLDDEFAALHRAIANVEPGAGGVLFLPWLNGSLSPIEDGSMRGGFLNMSLETTREQLGLAALEGVAFNFRWMRGGVEKFCKRRLSHLVFYGGGALSDVWSQIFADIAELPIYQAENPRFTLCRGAGLLGFYRAGRLDLDDLEKRIPIKKIYEPRTEFAPRYAAMFEQFVRAFRANRKIFHTLNR